MSKIYCFARYSQPENVVTNATLLLFLTLSVHRGSSVRKLRFLVTTVRRVEFKLLHIR